MNKHILKNNNNKIYIFLLPVKCCQLLPDYLLLFFQYCCCFAHQLRHLQKVFELAVISFKTDLVIGVPGARVSNQNFQKILGEGSQIRGWPDLSWHQQKALEEVGLC